MHRQALTTLRASYERVQAERDRWKKWVAFVLVDVTPSPDISDDDLRTQVAHAWDALERKVKQLTATHDERERQAIEFGIEWGARNGWKRISEAVAAYRASLTGALKEEKHG